MSAQDWLLIIGAVSGLLTVIGAQVVLIIKVIKADQRREEIAEAVLDPNVTELPPKK